jgi:hypothetical protein
MSCNKVVQFSDGTVITDYTEIDELSLILDKADCRLFLSPVSRGISLKEAEIDGLDKAAPLIYKLDIPVDIRVPDNTPDISSFALKVFSAFSEEFDEFVLSQYYSAKSDNASLFLSFVEVFGTDLLALTNKVTWRVFAFNCHNKTLDYITGIDNLVYSNISSRLDQLGYRSQ